MKKSYRLFRQLMLATTKIDGAYYFFAKKRGMKENTLALLYALDDGKPHSQKEICKDWLIPKTTINTNVKELTKAGYITLSRGENKREKAITLTEEGRAFTQKMLKNVYAAEQTAMEQTMQKFSPEFVDAIGYFADCLNDELQKRT